jgi:NAD(P)-dependent dehydrogenase (short-subunit alcohol dehydrogenase family)
MSGLLSGRNIVVTGAGDELGRLHARALLAEGACVYACDTSAGWGTDGRERFLETAGGGFENRVSMARHETDSAQIVEALWNAAAEAFGPLHGLVNAAGLTRDRTLAKMTDDEWHDVLDSCLHGVFLTTRVAARYWRRMWQEKPYIKSCVVNRTSTSAMPGQPGQANYAAAMSGVATFSIVAAREGAAYGMRVNAMCGPFNAQALRQAALRGKQKESGEDNQRWQVSPAVLSPAVAALLAPDCEITGQVLFVGQDRLQTLEPWTALSEISTAAGDGPSQLAKRLAQLSLRQDDW